MACCDFRSDKTPSRPPSARPGQLDEPLNHGDVKGVVWKENAAMFEYERRKTAGLGSIGGVALVLVLWLIGIGTLLKVYQAGGSSQLPPDGTCELGCQQGSTKAKG